MVDPQNVDWAEIRERLPYGNSKEERKKRRQMWKYIDVNGNGFVSLAEMDKGLRDVIQLDHLFDAKKVTMRAFQNSRNAEKQNANKWKNKQYKKYSEDYIERNELRYILKYIRRYFEYWVAFARLSDNNKSLKLDEFIAGKDELEKWVGPIDDAEAVFNEIDANGGGKILFSEWVEWAEKIKLDIDDDDDNASADEKFEDEDN